jgi:outer membrane biosynthesis protein TonB
MQRHLHAIFLVVLTATLETSCHKKQASVPMPPPPIPAAKPEPVAPVLEPPPDTPAVTVPPPSTAPPIATPAPTPTPPQEQPKPTRRGRSTPAPAAPAIGPAPAPSPAQPPQLGTLLTSEQQREYSSAIDQSVGRAQSSLRSIGNRQLTAEQHERVVQVENFIQQAESLRKSNLAGAKSLAERADVLARDLLASLH